MTAFKKQAASPNVKTLAEIENNRKRLAQASPERMSDGLSGGLSACTRAHTRKHSPMEKCRVPGYFANNVFP